MSGSYGLTKVVCSPVNFGPGTGRTWGDLRAWEKIVEIIGEL